VLLRQANTAINVQLVTVEKIRVDRGIPDCIRKMIVLRKCVEKYPLLCPTISTFSERKRRFETVIYTVHHLTGNMAGYVTPFFVASLLESYSVL
jgi:hypothetical protein